MKKSMVLDVLRAMSNVGFEVVEIDGMIKDLGEYEPLLTTIEEELNKIRIDKLVNIIVEEFEKAHAEEKHNQLKAVLKDFNDFVDQANVIEGKKVTVNQGKDDEYSYDMTYEDALDFVRSEWDNVAIRLCEEFGIDLDEE